MAIKLLLNIGGEILSVCSKNVKHAEKVKKYAPQVNSKTALYFQMVTREGPEASKRL